MKGIITNISEAAGRLGTKAVFKVKKASPELLLVGGIACIIGGTIMACKATRKADEIIGETQVEIDVAKMNTEDDLKEGGNEEALKEIEKKTIVKARMECVGRLIACYGPSVALGAAGIAMVFTSHGIMRKRQGALLASYNALDAAFKAYRQRVLAEEDGKERDRRYLIGPERSEEVVEFTEDENGKIVRSVNKEAMAMAGTSAYGPYTFEFSKFTSNRWQSHADSNLMLIRSAEDWGTSQLRLKGHLFLNDILEFLDMEPVPWGQLVGWIRGSKEGDSYVELLAYEDQQALEMDTDGWKKPIYITANCEGLIWHKL